MGTRGSRPGFSFFFFFSQFFFTRHRSASEPIRAVGFVGPCNDIFGQTRLEMKGGRREGVLGSRVGCRSKAAWSRARDKIGVCLRGNRKDMLRSPAARQPRGKRKITGGTSRLDGCSGFFHSVKSGLAIYGRILSSRAKPLNPRIMTDRMCLPSCDTQRHRRPRGRAVKSDRLYI